MTLIGMPGVGKSTVGVLLAKATGRSFLDTDLLIQEREGERLQALIAKHGAEAFCERENELIAALDCARTVIATGGSAVYGEQAMEHLRATSRVVHLALPLAELADRLESLAVRGVVMRPGQSLASLYAEREPLYRRYAHRTLPTAGLDQDQIVAALLDV